MEYGCIGEKLTHSFSKTIHNMLGSYNYELREIKKDSLDDFMKKADFKGINVTIPYKESVIPYLDKISDKARDIGAVNTIINENGLLTGFNTDFSGMKSMLLKYKIDCTQKKVLILGSGGTSKTAYAIAKDMNASEIIKASREGRDGAVTYEEVLINHTDAQIIINTTPVGMFPNIGAAAIDINLFPDLCGVADAVYNPLSSALIVAAKEMGITACGGLYMLVSQAISAAKIFPDCSLDGIDGDTVFEKIYRKEKNIVLVGMPGCGKTTIGKAVANRLNKTFIDTDEKIVEQTELTVPEIFSKYGEEGFRKIESDVIAKVSSEKSAVIATGGGAVLNRENIRLLKENGLVIFIDRPIEYLETSSDRPLSQNRGQLVKRFNERYDIYKSVSDIALNAQKELESNIQAVTEVFLNEDPYNQRP